MRHTIILSDVIALKSLQLDGPMGAGPEIIANTAAFVLLDLKWMCKQHN